MNGLQIFNDEEFGVVRTVTIDNEPWFVASDICKALEISNVSVAISRLDEDERSKFNLGRQGEGNIVSEYGLYSLVLASRKPEAKKFKRWVTHEILPSIRKYGVYAVDELLDNPDMAIKAFTALKEEREKNRLLRSDNECMKPHAVLGQAITTANTSILVGDLAKILRQNGIEVGGKRLFEWLRENGYLIKRKGTDWNLPTQRSMEMGLFEIKESVHIDGNGCNRITRTPKITGKGQEYFINKFLEGVANQYVTILN